MNEKLLKAWAIWKHNEHWREIKKESGQKAFSLEYRLMLEAGIVQLNPSNHSGIIELIDSVWGLLKPLYPDEMDSVYEYYLYGSYRAARLKVGKSQRSIRNLIMRGEILIEGGLAVFTGVGDS